MSGPQNLPNWKLIEMAAKSLAARSPDGTFTRKQLIDYINNVLLKGYPPRKVDSLNPMIQAVTANAPGGAPGGIGKNILYRVGRGRYRLFDPKTDRAIPEKAGVGGGEVGRGLEGYEKPPPPHYLRGVGLGDVYPSTIDSGGRLLIPLELADRLGLNPNMRVVCYSFGGRLLVEPVPDLRELLEEPRVRISLEEFLSDRRELSKRVES